MNFGLSTGEKIEEDFGEHRTETMDGCLKAEPSSNV